MSRITEPERVHLGLLALEKYHTVSLPSAPTLPVCVVKPVVLWNCLARPVQASSSGHIPSASRCLVCVTGFVCPTESSCCTSGSSGVLFVSLNGGGSISPCGTVEKV